jgi:hypothetical protein
MDPIMEITDKNSSQPEMQVIPREFEYTDCFIMNSYMEPDLEISKSL